MLNCRDVTELSSARLNGELSLARRLEIQMHLLICKHCRRFQRHFQHSQTVARQVAKGLWRSEPETAQAVMKNIQAIQAAKQDNQPE